MPCSGGSMCQTQCSSSSSSHQRWQLSTTLSVGMVWPSDGRDQWERRAREHKLHFFLANHVLPQNVCRPCVALHLSSAGENLQTLTKALWVWRAGITLWRSRRSSDNTCTHKMRPQSLQMHESALKNMHFSNKKDTREQTQGHLTAAMKCFYIYSSAHLIETRREKMSGSLLIHAGTLTQWCTETMLSVLVGHNYRPDISHTVLWIITNR